MNCLRLAVSLILAAFVSYNPLRLQAARASAFSHLTGSESGRF